MLPPMAVGRHLFRGIAKIEHLNVQLVFGDDLPELRDVGLRAPRKDPHDVAARHEKGLDCGEEPFEVGLVKQRLAVRETFSFKDLAQLRVFTS